MKFTYYSVINFTNLILLVGLIFFFLPGIRKSKSLNYILLWFFGNLLFALYSAYSYGTTQFQYDWLIYIGYFGIYLSWVASVQFSYSFLEEKYGRESKIALFLSIAISLAAYVWYFAKSYKMPLFLFENHSFSRPSRVEYINILMILLFFFWTQIVVIRKILHRRKVKRDEGDPRPILSFFLKPGDKKTHAYFLLFLVNLMPLAIMIVVFLANTGRLPWSSYTIVDNFLGLIRKLMLAILLINYSGYSITLMPKLMGIIMVMILVIVGLVSFVVMDEMEDAFDLIHLSKLESIERDIKTGNPISQLEDVSYVLSWEYEESLFPLDEDKEDLAIIYARGGKERQRKMVIESNSKSKEFFIWLYGDSQLNIYSSPWNDYLDRIRTDSWKERSVFNYRGMFSPLEYRAIHYDFYHDGRIYEIGYDYLQYRDFIHKTASRLIIVIIVISLALMVLPLLLYRSILYPINLLLHGVISMEHGKGRNVPVVFNDEIGRLTGSFNKMSTIIQSYYSEMEKEVQERTEDLQLEITERKRFEDALLESERTLNRAQKVARVGSWSIDLEKNKLDWSDEIYRIFEVPFGEELTYEKFLGHIHPDDKDHVTTSWKKALKGDPYDIEHRIIVDGHTKWVREIAEVHFGPDGRAIRGLGTVQDISDLKKVEIQLKKANDQLQALAMKDGLTDIANRRYFDLRLEEEWQRMMRASEPLSLLIFDVDHFKLYNDMYGHQAGDGCLMSIARIAQQVFKRPGDLLARYGGEEFVVILPGTDLEGAISVAEIAREEIRQRKMPHAASPVCDCVTISCGVTSLIPGESTTKEYLIELADRALYKAKSTGRNRVVSDKKG